MGITIVWQEVINGKQNANYNNIDDATNKIYEIFNKECLPFYYYCPTGKKKTICNMHRKSPDDPGVYLLYQKNVDYSLIENKSFYVGMSINLKQRIADHYNTGHTRDNLLDLIEPYLKILKITNYDTIKVKKNWIQENIQFRFITITFPDNFTDNDKKNSLEYFEHYLMRSDKLNPKLNPVKI